MNERRSAPDNRAARPTALDLRQWLGFNNGQDAARLRYPVYPVGSSSGTSPVLNRSTASANSPMSGSPVRENATAPAFVAASDRAREIAWVEDWDSIGSRATRSPSSLFSKAI